MKFWKKLEMGLVGAHNKPARNVLLLHGGYFELRASLVAKMIKNLPPMQETQVRSLGQEDLLEKGMATHSSILVWRIPWTEEAGGLQSLGLQRDYIDTF